MSTKNNGSNTSNTNMQESAYSTALLRSLQFSGVQFVRFLTVDACNQVRAKDKPVKYLLGNGHNATFQYKGSMPPIVVAGAPFHADIMVEGSGVEAKNLVAFHPDMNTFRVLPYAPKTAVVLGTFTDQYTDEPSPLCSRTVLQNVVQKAAQEHNISFTVGVELEFSLVNAKTHKFVDDSLFGSTVSLNCQQDFFSDLHDQLEKQYIPVELLHAECGPGQMEVVLKYSTDPVAMADSVLLTQETIKAVSRQHGYKALFAPKYDMEQAGNGIHVHLSLRDATTGRDLFTNKGTIGMSQQGETFVEGMLQHLPALMGLTIPTTNSFRRIGKGCWTGSEVGWALEDKDCGLRICSNLITKEWDHVEFKLCDSASNFYLALAGILGAGLEGLEKGLSLRPSLNEVSQSDATTESPAASMPATIEEALDALESDNLLTEQVLGPRLSQAYLALRRADVKYYSEFTLEQEVEEFLKRV